MNRIDAAVSREMDLFLEEIYGDSKSAGQGMADVNLGKSQVRGFESMLTSTSRFSEIINYIKNQAGKDTKGAWSSVAKGLLDQLERLENKAEALGKDDPSLILQIKIKLVRGWGKQVIAHCLYQRMLMGGR